MLTLHHRCFMAFICEQLSGITTMLSHHPWPMSSIAHSINIFQWFIDASTLSCYHTIVIVAAGHRGSGCKDSAIYLRDLSLWRYVWCCWSQGSSFRITIYETLGMQSRNEIKTCFCSFVGFFNSDVYTHVFFSIYLLCVFLPCIVWKHNPGHWQVKLTDECSTGGMLF